MIEDIAATRQYC